MSHYVCDGTCKGSSEYVGYCQSAGCTHQGGELKPCDCEDNKHAEVVGGGIDEENMSGAGDDDFAG